MCRVFTLTRKLIFFGKKNLTEWKIGDGFCPFFASNVIYSMKLATVYQAFATIPTDKISIRLLLQTNIIFGAMRINKFHIVLQ